MRYNSIRAQRGSGIMIALFVIIVMGLMAAAMTKIGWSSQNTTTKEVLAERAWLTAHSANEVLLTQIFPLGQPHSSDETACKALLFKPQDWFNCEAKVSCESRKISHEHQQITEYKLTSTATCGSKNITMTRTQEVWARGVK